MRHWRESPRWREKEEHHVPSGKKKNIWTKLGTSLIQKETRQSVLWGKKKSYYNPATPPGARSCP